jgi:hypothetical protein
MDFVTGFASQTSRGGEKRPLFSRFTVKDAMSIPMSRTIRQSNEEHFDLMRNDIKNQFEKAMRYMPNLKECCFDDCSGVGFRRGLVISVLTNVKL